ncbi:MAG: hypothetical protein PHW82_02535 [Bacteroidales bacterium]|nr:hypothetical protein [Bacteroidales bacterium]
MIFAKSKNQIRVLFIVNFVFIFSSLYSQNVGINTDTPDASALLELQSNESGFLPPRLTQIQRDAINNPATGLIIYNISEGCINYYDGALWLSLCGGVSTSSLIIETQPANVSECAGSNASFSVSATEGVTYQWQVNTGSDWQNISSAGTNPVYSNYTTATINLSGIVAGNNGWLYRCIVTGNTPPPAVSNAATLNIIPLPTIPSAISGESYACGSSPISTIQEFNSDVLTHGTSPSSTNIWFAPDYHPPIAFSATGGCTGGCAGYASSWNNHWGNFLRLPEMDCSGNDEVSISFDVSHSYFSSHPNDWCRFYMWADGEYKHNITSVTINGTDVTYDSGMNGKGFQFTEERTCAHVVVTFDISAIGNKTNILFYLEPSCGYNNSNAFYVWFDNISVNTSGSSNFDYSVINEGYTYTWQVPTDWTINSGQGSNIISVTPGSLDGDIIVTPSNTCGNGPSQTLNVSTCP